MVNYPVNMKTTRPARKLQKTINSFLGIVTSTSNSRIDERQSPDMLNLVLDDKLVLDKRFGYSKIFENSIGEGGIKGLMLYRKSTGNIFVIAHGTKLYKHEEGINTEIYSGINGSQVKGFTYKDYLYILDGTKYLRYDGTDVIEVKTIAYKPTIRISTPPSGGGSFFEDFNLISSGFKQSFSGNGTDTTYQLVVKDLDETEVSIVINETTTLTEETNFTVNRANGTIDFAGGTSPHGAPVDGTNNVVVTAYKTVDGNLNKIQKCTFFVVWGGLQDTRVFVSGNQEMKNYDFRCGLDDPTYFPENGFYKVGNDDTAVTGYSTQFESLVIHKENENWRRDYSLNSGVPTFNTFKLNDGIGCSVTDTIALINNKPVMLHKTGIHVVLGSNVKDERNTALISNDINKNIDTLSTSGLLEVDNLQDYKSIDYDKKYILFNKTTGLVWVYDYRFGDLEGQWFPCDNMYASSVIEIDNKLYFGDSRDGYVYVWDNKNSDKKYRDVEAPINAYVRTKIFDLDFPTRLKFIDKLFLTIKAGDKTSCTIKYRINNEGQWQLIGKTFFNNFSYATLQYSTLNYSGNIFPLPIREDIRLRKVSHMQLEFSNNELDENFGIMDYSFVYSAENEYK